jgi:hypothetical protein
MRVQKFRDPTSGEDTQQRSHMPHGDRPESASYLGPHRQAVTLRHVGGAARMAAVTPGASLADLMARMGHDSARAAMIYQHETDEANHAIADALTERLNQHRRKANDEDQAGSHADGPEGEAEAS